MVKDMDQRRSNKDFHELETNSYHLERGYLFFSQDESLVRTVLGSSVSVCLWDKEKKVGGVNHFMYPETNEKDKQTAKYGNIAILALLKMMNVAGCKKSNITAQIVGGAWPQDFDGIDLGSANIQIARKILKKYGIRIISEDTGGSMGRKVVFDLGSGQLIIMKVHSLRDSDWITPEKTYRSEEAES